MPYVTSEMSTSPPPRSHRPWRRPPVPESPARGWAPAVPALLPWACPPPPRCPELGEWVGWGGPGVGMDGLATVKLTWIKKPPPHQREQGQQGVCKKRTQGHPPQMTHPCRVYLRPGSYMGAQNLEQRPAGSVQPRIREALGFSASHKN